MAADQEILPIPEETAALQKMRPVKELAGFGKIFLNPGETGQIKIALKGRTDTGVLGVGSSVKSIRRMISGQN